MARYSDRSQGRPNVRGRSGNRRSSATGGRSGPPGGGRGRGGKDSSRGKFTPSADRRLESVFRRIGVPEPEPFVPDPFQVRAVELLEHGDVLVSAPTGSGKTWIAEQAIENVLARGGRSWYATPLKALSNSKLVEFGERFGTDNVGILTGDRKENTDAPVIVGTTEILRNQMYDCMHQGTDLGADLVILDEAHYLGDPDRGVVWEETMIYLPGRVPLLLLSATVGNADEIADWLTSIRGRPCNVVLETRRPVPLYPLFLHPKGTLMPLVSKKGLNKGRPLEKRVYDYVTTPNAPVLKLKEGMPPWGDVLAVLREYNLLPAIFFLKSRADCDKALSVCPNVLDRDGERRREVVEHLNDILEDQPFLARHRQRKYIEHSAVASHHSGQLPAWKLVVEEMMTKGLLDAVFATSTVAAGVNFPARTIVLSNSDRFNGVEFEPLSATEYHQMTGRAGRRGMDAIGFALMLPGRFMDLKHIGDLQTEGATPVLSRIRVNFSMALNLLLSHQPADIRLLLENSFATFLAERQGPKAKKRAARSGRGEAWLWQDFVRHLRFLKAEGYVGEDDRLTGDGLWASQLRVDQPLMIAECLRQGLFPEGDPALLAALLAPFVLDREHDVVPDQDFLAKHMVKAFAKMIRALTPLARRKTEEGFAVRPLSTWAAATVHVWASGASWETAVSVAALAEGDLAMLVLRTVENLRQVASLDESHPAVARDARAAIDLLLRPPVTSHEDFYPDFGESVDAGENEDGEEEEDAGGEDGPDAE
ncbi:MAG: DEAD/DEAH box helicase [Desulfatibacillaceae bacterium]